MFLKKISFILIIIFTITLLAVPALAAGNDPVYEKGTASTKQFLVTIYRPEGDETKFEKSYVICAGTEKEDIRVELLQFNEKTGLYEPKKDIDGESGWDISSTLFTREISLDEGANKIRFVAFKKKDAQKLQVGTNLQVNNFTITVLNKSFIQKIKENLFNLPDMFSSFVR